MKKIAIIGGGASGMMCGITAARLLRNNGIDYNIVIYEKNTNTGKKLLATGNGRCNFTNLKALDNIENCYCGVKSDSVAYRVLFGFSPEEAMGFFESIGVSSLESEDGRIYPACMQASAVLELLRAEILRLGILVKQGYEAIKINPLAKKLRIDFKNDSILADMAVIATGANAAPKTGSDGTGIKLLRSLGHRIAATYPALTGFKTRDLNKNALRGVRCDRVLVTLYKEGKAVSSDLGEVQFNQYGISGIPVMNVSVFAGADLSDMYISLDFMPNIGLEELKVNLIRRKKELGHLTAEQFLWGFLNKQLSVQLILDAKIEPIDRVKDINNEKIERLAGILKDWHINITATAGYDNAQATGGGIVTGEFTDGLESKLTKGVYACGEVLDVCGICGGYNLHWAWASGYAAALGVTNKCMEN